MLFDFLTLLFCILLIILLFLHRLIYLLILNTTFKVLFVMKNLLIVEVSVKTMNPKEPFKKVFSRQIESSSDLKFPYEQITNSLLFLFGVGSVVTISTHNLL